MRHADYAAAVGRGFTVAVDEATRVELVLVACSDAVAGGGWVSFQLEFHGPASAPLDQGTWTFEADGAEPVDIFIVPTGATADHVDYTAAFTVEEASA